MKRAKKEKSCISYVFVADYCATELYLQFFSENNFKKSLQQLTTYIRPILNQAKLISDLCTELFKSNARGAVILSILHEKALNSAGDIGGQKILYLLGNIPTRFYISW